MLSELSIKIAQLDYDINEADLDVSAIRDQLAALVDIVGGLIGYLHMAERAETDWSNLNCTDLSAENLEKLMHEIQKRIKGLKNETFSNRKS